MKALERELKKIEKAEEKLRRQAEKKLEPAWKKKLEERIPEKLLSGLQKAFSKAFYLIFENGTVWIEKTYDRDSLEKDFMIKDYAVDLKGNRKELAKLKHDIQGGNMLNTLLTTVEGVGLGALGIGLPDIVLWTGMMLKGVYETALKYGFSYETPEEKLFILHMLKASMLNDAGWPAANDAVDAYIRETDHHVPSPKELKAQIEDTANVFATDMLVLKFIQGLPVVGMLGGAGNPVYYQKIMKYVQIKYRKRYLLSKIYTARRINLQT